ncbi:hypothetical protein J6590_084255 [Homalodisca vitripennis]|nr:hypothetical protein J6590_084255 [Homalodisca vitripennis]
MASGHSSLSCVWQRLSNNLSGWLIDWEVKSQVRVQQQSAPIVTGIEMWCFKKFYLNPEQDMHPTRIYILERIEEETHPKLETPGLGCKQETPCQPIRPFQVIKQRGYITLSRPMDSNHLILRCCLYSALQPFHTNGAPPTLILLTLLWNRPINPPFTPISLCYRFVISHSWTSMGVAQMKVTHWVLLYLVGFIRTLRQLSQDSHTSCSLGHYNSLTSSSHIKFSEQPSTLYKYKVVSS